MGELIGDNIKAVVFDFDDTLVATHLAIWELHRYIARTYYGIELTDETIRKHWGRPLQELASKYYQTDSIEDAVARMAQHQLDFPKGKLEHSDEVLRHLKLSGKIIGIVSAISRPVFKKDIEMVGLPIEGVDYIQTAEDSRYHKPDSRVFDPMLEWMASRDVE